MVKVIDGVSGDDISSGWSGLSSSAVLASVLELLWEERGREQCYCCSEDGRLRWVLTACLPVATGDGRRVTGDARVTFAAGDTVSYRVTYHLDPSEEAGYRFVRTEVERVA